MENNQTQQSSLDSAEETLVAKGSVLSRVTPLSKYLAMALFVISPFVGGWVGYQSGLAQETVPDGEKNVVLGVPTHEQIQEIRQKLIDSGEVYSREDYFAEIRKVKSEYTIVGQSDAIVSFYDYGNGRYVAHIAKYGTEDLGRYLEINSNYTAETLPIVRNQNEFYSSFSVIDGASEGYSVISPDEQYLAYVEESEKGNGWLVVYDLVAGEVAYRSGRYEVTDGLLYGNERFTITAVSWSETGALLVYEQNVDFADVVDGEIDYTMQGLGDPTQSIDLSTGIVTQL